MDDIDIIDKYLTGNLSAAEEKQFKERYLNDAEFKKEVEVFRKIYQGVELVAEKELKKRLDQYYDQYIEDNALSDTGYDSKIRPIDWKKRLYFISGIAASICLAAGAYWFFQTPPKSGGAPYTSNKPGINKPAKTTKPDTQATRPIFAGDKKRHDKIGPTKTPDSIQGVVAPTINGSYAFTSQQRLPANAICRASYPQPLTYTFSQGVLTVDGDPLLALWDFDLFKIGEQYYVVYNNSTYPVIQTNTAKPLVKQGFQIKGEGSATAEKVLIQVAPLKTEVYEDPPIGVVLSQSKGGHDYLFTREKGKTILVLQGGFTANNCSVVSLTKDGKTSWYVLSGQRIFVIEQSPDKSTPLKELLGKSSEIARLFIKRDAFSKTILSATN